MTADNDNRMLKTSNKIATATFFFCSSEFRYMCAVFISYIILFLRTFNLVLLLGRVALVTQRPIVVKLFRGRSVGLPVRTYMYIRASVGRSVCPVHCGKTADRIRRPFGVIGRTGPEMKQVVGLGDRSMERGTL